MCRNNDICLFYFIIFAFILIINVVSNSPPNIHHCSSDGIALQKIKNNKNILDNKNIFDSKWEFVLSKSNGHTIGWNNRQINNKHNKSIIIDDYNYYENVIDDEIGNIDIPIIFHILYNGQDSTTSKDLVDEYSIFIDRLNYLNLYFNKKNLNLCKYNK